MTDKEYHDKLAEIVSSRGKAIKRVEEKLEQSYLEFLRENGERLAREQVSKFLDSTLKEVINEYVSKEVDKVIQDSLMERIRDKLEGITIEIN